MLEAVSVSSFGGLIGVLFGFAASSAVAFYTNWDTIITSTSILLSFGISAAVGIAFGFYPAKQAADLSPIDALRYE